MRISYWSSDVCSSDLVLALGIVAGVLLCPRDRSGQRQAPLDVGEELGVAERLEDRQGRIGVLPRRACGQRAPLLERPPAGHVADAAVAGRPEKLREQTRSVIDFETRANAGNYK